MKYLSEIPVSEDVYKVDFQVLDRYQGFSAELLRVSLLGLTAYGFLLVNVYLKFNADGSRTELADFALNQSKWIIVVGAAALALSAGCALGHRYFSTDCMTHHVRTLRLRHRLAHHPNAGTEMVHEVDELHKEGTTPPPGQQKSVAQTILDEVESLRRDLGWCRWLLLASSGFLLVGVGAVAAAFGVILIRS